MNPVVRHFDEPAADFQEPTSRVMGSLSRAALGCLLAIAMGKPHDAQASTLRVPQDYKSIQAAFDAAAAGDTVLVTAGTYRERIRLKQGVALRSAGSDEKGMLGLKRAEAVVIDGGGVGEQPGGLMAPDATLDGVTVTTCGIYEEAKSKEDWETRGENQKHEHIGHFGAPAIGVVGATCVIVNCIVHHNGDTGIGIRGALLDCRTILVPQDERSGERPVSWIGVFALRRHCFANALHFRSINGLRSTRSQILLPWRRWKIG
ncbi:MAG: hypothetical protein IT428_12970 [Planctomycetaceae bacterium]|nr:hypothetical protein [Planctomycetaceae bacterium]